MRVWGGIRVSFCGDVVLLKFSDGDGVDAMNVRGVLLSELDDVSLFELVG